MGRTMPSPRILVAEDDSLVAATVVDALQDEGFVVTLAGDSVAALEAAAHAGFDALLTDLRMPDMDGITLIERMRAEDPMLPNRCHERLRAGHLTTILRRNSSGRS